MKVVSFFFASINFTQSWVADKDYRIVWVSASTPQGCVISFNPTFTFADFGLMFTIDQVVDEFMLLAYTTLPIGIELDFTLLKGQSVYAAVDGGGSNFVQIFLKEIVTDAGS